MDFKAKMHQIRFRLGWGSTPDPVGELTALPVTRNWIWGTGWAGEKEGTVRERGGKGKWKGGKGREPKLLLNQGRSEPWYATD